MPFLTLGLTPTLVNAASRTGFDQPTPIQLAAIPALLRGSDMLASAQTGTGKTAAFALPLLHFLQRKPQARPRLLRALVLVPTRELAAQVGGLIRSLAQHLPEPPKVAVLFGGVSINPQMMALRGGADAVVATPGRLLDLLAHNALNLRAVELLVLDEADRLLDLGFADELAKVLAQLPAQRQTALFSATFAPAVQALANQLLRQPERIEVLHTTASPATETPLTVQRVIEVDAPQRTPLLRHLIKNHSGQRMLVFVATQYAAEHVAEKLYKTGIFAAPFHGGLSQGARTQTLAEFKEGRWDALITTDLAARGIDIAELPIVLNYDLPRSATDYVHRIGRTGRAGSAGLAISFVSAGTAAHFGLIEKRQNLALEREQIEGFAPTELALEQPDLAPVPGTGGIKGKRPSKKDKLRSAALAIPGPKL